MTAIFHSYFRILLGFRVQKLVIADFMIFISTSILFNILAINSDSFFAILTIRKLKHNKGVVL